MIKRCLHFSTMFLISKELAISREWGLTKMPKQRICGGIQVRMLNIELYSNLYPTHGTVCISFFLNSLSIFFRNFDI